ncbi:Initiator tRNA phosphoribosyl transferase [Metarhizium robertsii ARSEF 23]|uniref:Initiator tRNA phosphoribosyl transferase n=1 Tax=Metarhizium robertsii (strain ARSEF 23 / ATCC MYA-3075) TaxID=655844 RepID=E9EL36_METRA|nr:Initiator tRNA phosphoribosyl transferase [Metarhizium robertsii ARSEF 23]EFZ04427.1 Initiator tRNA phosphoribosyl transferase [Metarhizium robertsii ARSEF 23]
MTNPNTININDIVFPSQPSLSTLLTSLKRSTLSIHNRLTSILSDAEFVHQAAQALKQPPSNDNANQETQERAPRPLVANERCGSWYIPPGDKYASAYFKSTDGHERAWKFSTRRLNLHLLDMIEKHDGNARRPLDHNSNLVHRPQHRPAALAPALLPALPPATPPAHHARPNHRPRPAVRRLLQSPPPPGSAQDNETAAPILGHARLGARPRNARPAPRALPRGPRPNSPRHHIRLLQAGDLPHRLPPQHVVQRDRLQRLHPRRGRRHGKLGARPDARRLLGQPGHPPVHAGARAAGPHRVPVPVPGGTGDAGIRARQQPDDPPDAADIRVRAAPAARRRLLHLADERDHAQGPVGQVRCVHGGRAGQAQDGQQEPEDRAAVHMRLCVGVPAEGSAGQGDGSLRVGQGYLCGRGARSVVLLVR